MNAKKIIAAISIIIISIISLVVVANIANADRQSDSYERELNQVSNSIKGMNKSSQAKEKMSEIEMKLEGIYEDIKSKQMSGKTNTEELEAYKEACDLLIDLYEEMDIHTSSVQDIRYYRNRVLDIIQGEKVELEQPGDDSPTQEDPNKNRPTDPTYNPDLPTWGLNVGDKFTYTGFNNDYDQYAEGSNVTPTTLKIKNDENEKEIIEKDYSVYCVDRGYNPSSRLRTSNLRTAEEGDVLIHHEYSTCNGNSEENLVSTPPDTETVYYDPPEFTIGKRYDITGDDKSKQYVGYIFGNLNKKRGDKASWVGQNAIWQTEINKGYKGLTNAKDDFESDPTAIAKSQEVIKLNVEDLNMVEQIATRIQNVIEIGNDEESKRMARDEIKKHLISLIEYFNIQINREDTTTDLKQFYISLIRSQDGLEGLLNWVNVVEEMETISNIRANVYQYLITIDDGDTKSIVVKIKEKVEDLQGELKEIEIGDGNAVTVAGALVSEALVYQDFYNELQKNNGELKTENKTGNTDVLIDRNSNTYTVGPFKVSYYNKAIQKSAATGERIDFAKITAIKILNQNGTVYKTLSEDKLDEKGNVLEKGKQEFKITKTPKQLETDEKYIFPANDEAFYIQFTGDRKNSKETLDPSAISLEIEFSYISHYKAELYRTEVGENQPTQSSYKWVKLSNAECAKHKVSNPNHTDCSEHTCIKRKYVFTKQDTVRLQEQLLISESVPVIKTKTLRITPSRQGDDDDDDDYKHYDEITMRVSGTVFLDENAQKETLPNGMLDSNEQLLKNIEVSLYEYDETTGKSTLATLAPAKADENGKTAVRTNPTVTDENGVYIFDGVRAMNKYYVEFKYNGQLYQATVFTEQEATQEGQEETKTITSIAKEIQNSSERTVETGIERETYNARFENIESWPTNYETTNSLEYGVSGKTYTQKELMGYKLVGDAEKRTFGYEKDDSVLQLLDEVITEEREDGKVIREAEFIEGIISQKINEYIYGKHADGRIGTRQDPGENANGKYPDLKEDIYSKIIDEYSSKDPEIKDKLQFIEDIKMTSDTNKGGIKEGLLAHEDQFTLGKKTCQIGQGEYYLVDTAGYKVDFAEAMKVEKQGKWIITYHSLYGELKDVNFGINERQKADIAIGEDVEKVTLEINGKSHEYKYSQREIETDENGNAINSGIWEIGVRLSDGYFDTNYSRELYKSDYLYKASNYGDASIYGKSKSDELEVFVTYKIALRNQLAIETKINEVVQYYDEDYEYVPERSYGEITQNIDANREKIIHTVTTSDGRQVLKTSYNEETKTSDSKYGKETQTEIEGYKALYIHAFDDTYLTQGQSAYIYITFKLGKEQREGEDWLKIDQDENTAEIKGVGKESIVEINGYSTRYGSGAQVPNVGDVEGKPAGLIDTDSNPGNLDPQDFPKDGEISYKAEAGKVNALAFEDDTDKAPNIRIILNADNERIIEGTVWEDERNKEVLSATIGNGIKDEGEKPINGVTVQLVELMENGTEHIWRQYENGSGTASETSPIINKNGIVKNHKFEGDYSGKYAFKSFVPGTYMVRFIYGDTVKTVLVNSEATGDNNTNKSADIAKAVKNLFGEDGLNKKSYNGQDYKSTTYQAGIEQTGEYSYKVDSNGQLVPVKAYTDVETQNESGTYYYNMAKADENENISDAKDIMVDNNQNIVTSRQNKDLNSRQDVIEYSNEEVTNHIAEILASYVERPSYENTKTGEQEAYTPEEVRDLIQELIEKTKMTAETGVMNIEVEYNTQNTGNQSENNGLTYQVKNVNLGLEERPKSQIAVEKEVTNVKVELADQSILFDASSQAENVLWQKHQKYNTGYKGNLLDDTKFNSIENIRAINSSKYGVVQLSMDEEIMHGATLQVTYKITARNVGETNYLGNDFYYTGNVSNPLSVSATSVDQVVDYIANNLQFNVNNEMNKDWKTISKEDLINNGLVNSKLETQISDYSTIIITDKLGASLVPTIYKEKQNRDILAEDHIDTTLVLSQVISPENDGDDLSYRNIIEAVKTSNTVGRKNQYSVVGNQNPRMSPQEIDSDIAETVRILPPFGAIPTNYILWIAIGLILSVGIGFITFKVLKKK